MFECLQLQCKLHALWVTPTWPLRKFSTSLFDYWLFCPVLDFRSVEAVVYFTIHFIKLLIINKLHYLMIILAIFSARSFPGLIPPIRSCLTRIYPMLRVREVLATWQHLTLQIFWGYSWVSSSSNIAPLTDRTYWTCAEKISHRTRW